MKTEHTPTPWAEMNSHKAGHRNVVSWGDDEPQNRKFICEITPSDTAVADCSFIVRACNSHEELVAVAKGILTLHDDAVFISGDDDAKLVDDALSAIREAIKKASEK